MQLRSGILAQKQPCKRGLTGEGTQAREPHRLSLEGKEETAARDEPVAWDGLI